MKQFLVSTVILYMFVSSALYADDTTVNDVAAEVKKYDIVRNQSKYRGELSKKGLRIIDTNKDGQIDLNEYLSHAEARFQKMDLNSDGFLTKEEGREAGKLMRAKMKEKRRELRELNEKQDSDQ